MKDTLPPLPDSPSRSNSTSNISTPPSPGSPSSALVRRHHTLSTSAGSKLNFSERREARTALLSTGLSEADINYYVPSSPIDSVIAWSDNGHSGNSTTTTSSSSSSSNIPLSKSSNSHRHVRGVSIGGSSTSSSSVFDESAETSPSQLSTSSPTFHSSTLPSSPPPASSSRRSSFVVLRGARGDAALTERRTVSDSRRLSSGASSTPGHRNSLTSFLENDAEGLGQEDEEWEKGLKDERDREHEERVTNSTFSSPPSTSNSPFRLPARATTLSHTRSISSVTQSDAWHSKEVPSVLRRPQSLNFRPSPSSRANNSEAWRSHDRGVSEGYAMISSVPPPPPMSNSSSYSSRSPIPLSEPSTPHNNNKSGLTHSNSYSSQHSNSGRHNNNNGGGSGLTHSNSFGSHHSHHSISNGVVGVVAATSSGGPLSPVGGFGRSPWSPTREETQGMVSRAGITGSPPKNGGSSMLNRHGSNSSGDSGRQYLDAEDDIGDDEEIDVVDLVTRPNIQIGEASNSRNSRSILTTSTNSDILRSTSPSSPSPSRRLPPLVTNPEILAPKKASFRNRPGPASASPFVPPIGHSHLQALSSPSTHQPQHPSTHPSFHQSYTSSTNRSYNYKNDRKNQTAAPGTGSSEWSRQKELLVGGTSNGTSNGGFTSSSNDWPPSGGFGVGLAIQQQQQIQVLQNQMMQAMEAMEALKLAGVGGANFGNLNMSGMMGNQMGYNTGVNPNQLQQEDLEVEEPPIDVPTLIREKGYNPILFDLKPPNARFFVIKSYTEEDVHKSLKHEIWASTDLGNKRLDKAFRENDSKGPIYLFFSVNGSGHFAGVARMISAVDYTTSSTVWASDKWKGIFQVQWIYIKDVPLASLRHIRLANTPENKPVTSSRDTQEVPYEAGCEVLRILSTYLARTSLLQDFAWYEAKKDEPPTSATTTDSATTSTTATPSILSKSLPQINSHYNSHRPSIPFPAPQGNYLQQPFQLYPQPQSQQYYTNNNHINNTSNLNYQQQQHQAHFVPPPFQTQLLQQPIQIMNPFQYNPLLMQQQQLFQQQQQYYNARKYSNSNSHSNKGASGSGGAI